MRVKSVNHKTKTVTFENDNTWAGEIGEEFDSEKLVLLNKITKLEAELFNLKVYYETVYDNYCNLADFLAEKLGKKNTDEAMDEFKEWLLK